MEPAVTGATAASQRIVTPEAVILDLERAGVASRTLAFTIDILALGAVLVAIAFVVTQTVGNIEGIGGAVAAVLTSAGVVVVWFCAWETLWRGRTPGKAALGLRAVSQDGTTIRFQQAFVRAAVGLIDIFIPPVGFTAVVSALLSPRDQRLGDMAAGTLVVRERSAQSLVVPAWFSPPPGYEGYVASLDVSALDDDAYGLVRTFLMRYAQLTPGAREHLALRLANPLAVRMDHSPPRWLHPYMFLVCLAAAWQRTHGAPAPAPPAWR
ncbi:MAG TPA: RDD family protein [Acidimicrobiales bacterium]|jgi:uncharacterized RDD family membrane protein YckC|nr:RDD family protein [Acidimicrobiales bacterium]